MKEGVVKEIKEYFKYGENGEEIIITKKEYDELDKKWRKTETQGSDIGPVGYNVYTDIRLSTDSIIGIIGILAYDRGLNLFAIEKGYHPVSGYKSSNTNVHMVKQRNNQIELFGVKKLFSEQEVIGKERCEKCRQ